MKQDQMKKVYVQVDVSFSNEGKMKPKMIVWGDGKKFQIDKILEIRPASAEKKEEPDDRYKIKIKKFERYLFFEHSTDAQSANVGRWFVEARS